MIRVLLIDDEPALIEVGTLFLERSGTLSIDSAMNFQLAIEKLKNESFDVIVADYTLPSISYPEMFQGLRVSGSSVPIIIFTGKDRDNEIVDALKCKSVYYLQKSGHPTELFSKLEELIKKAYKESSESP